MVLKLDPDVFFSQFGGRIFTIGAVSIAFGILALSVLTFPVYGRIFQEATSDNHGDFVSFYRAGEMALAGDASSAYAPAAFQAGLPKGNSAHLWLYPPTSFLLTAPLAIAPYGVAKSAMMLATVLAAFLIAYGAAPNRPLTVFSAVFSPAMFCSLFMLQVGAIVAAMFTIAFWQAARRPLFAGVLFGLLTLKPQYGLMAPVFLLASNNKRAFITALAVALFLAAASTAGFGAHIWKVFYESMGTTHTALALQAQLGGMSALQLAVKLGGGAFAAFSLQAAVILIAAACVVLAQRQLSHHSSVAVALLASVAAAPSAWIYDWPFVVAALAFYSGDNRNWNTSIQIAALALWITVFFPMFGVGGDKSIVAPLALLASLVAIFIFLLRKSTAQKFQSAR